MSRIDMWQPKQDVNAVVATFTFAIA